MYICIYTENSGYQRREIGGYIVLFIFDLLSTCPLQRAVYISSETLGYRLLAACHKCSLDQETLIANKGGFLYVLSIVDIYTSGRCSMQNRMFCDIRKSTELVHSPSVDIWQSWQNIVFFFFFILVAIHLILDAVILIFIKITDL